MRARSEGLDPVIRWSLNEDDAKLMLRAVQVLTEIFFAAGAEKVMPGVHGLPEEITSTLGAQAIADHPIRPRDLVMASSHVFCTTRMHGDAAKGVVDEIGRCHGFDNLFIADTGIFPRCPSVNPMYTVMALAHFLPQAERRR